MPPAPPTIRRAGDRLFVDTAAGQVELVPSRVDRRRARWWRAVNSAGKPVTPWLATPRIAAIYANRR